MSTFRNLIVLSLFLSFLPACASIRTSDTSRTGLEQLLISDAVDKTLARTELPPVDGRKVFVDTQFLDCVDKGYIIGTIRQRLLNGGAMLVDKKEDSQLTIEVCSGGVGTDNSNSFFGLPGLALPGPMPINLPEVRFYDKSRQAGTAKISVVAYDTASGSLVFDAGNSMAISEDNRWSLLGMGPFMEGDVRRQMSAAAATRFSGGNAGTTRSASSKSSDASIGWK